MDLGRQPWSRFAAFLLVTLLLGVLQREWLLVSVDVLLLGSLVESVLERAGEQRHIGWPTVRSGWPGSYLVWLPVALLVGGTAAYLDLPAAFLMPMLAVAASYLLVAPCDDRRTPDAPTAHS